MTDVKIMWIFFGLLMIGIFILADYWARRFGK